MGGGGGGMNWEIGLDIYTLIWIKWLTNKNLMYKKKNIFLMRTIFKVFIEFVTILLLFYVLVFWP